MLLFIITINCTDFLFLSFECFLNVVNFDCRMLKAAKIHKAKRFFKISVFLGHFYQMNLHQNTVIDFKNKR